MKTIEQYIPCISEDYLKRIGRKIHCSWNVIYELLKDRAKEKYEQVVKDIFKTSKLKKLTLVYMNKKLYEI